MLELALGIYLTFKGFKPSPIISGNPGRPEWAPFVRGVAKPVVIPCTFPTTMPHDVQGVR